MPIVQVAPATRKGMKLLISLFGESETGKTYSALKLMAGIEPDPAKRGFLDSEGGERGRAYVDAIPGGFMYGALTPPFTPERYIEALNDFVEAGVTTLAVDSVSHAWFAEGGVLDMVESAREVNDMAKWAKPKRRLGKLTNKWLTCGLHLILCSRAKRPYIKEVGPNGKDIYVPGPIVPIQEKSLRYDMTIMALMLGDGRFSIAKEHGGKCPGALRPIFANELMDETMGKKLIEWIGGMDALTPEQRTLKLRAAEEASKGTALFRKWYGDQTKADQKFIYAQLDNFLSIARATDDEEARRAQEEKDAAANLADPFGAAGTDKPALPGGVQKVGGASADDDFPGRVTPREEAA